MLKTKPILKSSLKIKARNKNNPTNKKKTLSPLQKKFAKEFIIDLCGTQALIRAGYNKNSAKQQASLLLTSIDFAHVQLEIKRLMDKRSKILDVKAEKVLREVGLLAFSNMMDYITIDDYGNAVVDLSAIDRDHAAAISELTTEEKFHNEGDEIVKTIKTKIKLYDKKSNLELFGKHLGMFSDKFQHLIGKADDEAFRDAFFGVKT